MKIFYFKIFEKNHIIFLGVVKSKIAVFLRLSLMTLDVAEKNFLSNVPKHVDLPLAEYTKLCAVKEKDAIHIFGINLQG